MKPKFEHPHVQERRRYPRKETFWHAQLQTPVGDFDCHVINLSARGATIEIGISIGPTQSVTLIIKPLGQFSGFVAWTDHNQVGIQTSEHRTTRTSSQATASNYTSPLKAYLR